MFDFKKQNKDIKKQSEEQYKSLLSENGYSTDNVGGFILGEKKEIYDEGTSLDDIISGHLFQWEQKETPHKRGVFLFHIFQNFIK